MKISLPALLSAATVAALVSLAPASRAGTMTLTVDSSESSLTLSGMAFGLPFTAQTSGSMVDAVSGTLQANLSGGVLTFSGGSAITLMANPAGPFSTAPNPIGSEAGNFGVSANGFITGYGAASVNGVYRGMTFDITAGTAQNGVAPTGETFTLTAGTLDYGITLNGLGQSLSASLVGVGGQNTATTVASFDGSVLTLPVQIDTGAYANREEEYVGTLVATVVPEPSAPALAGMGVVGFALWRFRRS